MANSICLRCLSRPLAQAEQTFARSPASVITAAAASFSTSPLLAANPPKKKGAVAVKKGGQSYKQGRVGGKSGGAGGAGRAPGSGERKALRKRVILSNTNALEVQGMQDLGPDNMTDSSRLGQVVGLTNVTVDSLRASEAFKATQGWSMFRRPATLVRKETIELAKMLDEAQSKTVRKVVYGDRASGKSVLLLQAKAIAFEKGWLVVHIPEGTNDFQRDSSLASSS